MENIQCVLSLVNVAKPYFLPNMGYIMTYCNYELVYSMSI